MSNENELSLITIDVDSFVDARKFEITQLQKDINVNVKHRNRRQLFQTLPRSMRRRAASHDSRRLPSRLRSKHFEPSPNAPAKHRSAKRKVRNIQAFYAKKSTGTWLPTHLWHAKRCRMQSIWGHRLACKSNDKRLSKCLKASTSGCFIIDVSFLSFTKEVSGIQLLQKGPCTMFGTFRNFTQTFAMQFPFADGDSVAFKDIFTIHPASNIGEQLGGSSFTHSAFLLWGPTSNSLADRIFRFKVGDAGTVAGRCLAVSDPTRINFKKSKPYFQESINISLHDWSKLFFCTLATESRPATRHQLVNPPTTDDCIPKIAIFMSHIGNNMYLIFTPKQYALEIWRVLNFSGAVYGTLAEYEYLHQEHNLPFFPNDFPLTSGHGLYADRLCVELTKKFHMKPSSKRGVNFSKLGIDKPFFCDFGSLLSGSLDTGDGPSHKSLQWGRLAAKNGGIPKRFDSVHDGAGNLIGYITSAGYSRSSGCVTGIASLIIDKVGSHDIFMAKDRTGGSQRLTPITLQLLL